MAPCYYLLLFHVARAVFPYHSGFSEGTRSREDKHRTAGPRDKEASSSLKPLMPGKLATVFYTSIVVRPNLLWPGPVINSTQLLAP